MSHKAFLTEMKNNKIESTWLVVFTILGSVLPWFFLSGELGWGIDGMYTLTTISVIATVIGLVSGYLQIYKYKTANLWNAVSFILTGYVLWFNGLYFVSITNWGVIVPILIYGTYQWFKNDKNGTKIEIRGMKSVTFWSIFGLATLLGLGVSSMLGGITQEWTYYGTWFDGILATWMSTGMILLALRYRESYKIFVSLNVVYVIYTVLQVAGVGVDGNQIQLMPTLILYFAFTMSASWGIYKWRQ